MKTALTISASDSCGAGGVACDLKTFTVLGVYGMGVITAVNAQNTQGLKATQPVPADLIARQIDTVAGDISVDACKVGFLPNIDAVVAVQDAIKRGKLQPCVCDPALPAGAALDRAVLQAVQRHLFPLITLLTAGRREAALWADVETVQAVPAAKDCARRIAGLGARAVVIQGLAAADQTVDLYFDGREFLEFAAPTQPAEKSLGAGDAFSAAITAALANRVELVPAIDQAKQLVTMAIQYSDGQGRGTAPVNVLSFGPKKK